MNTFIAFDAGPGIQVLPPGIRSRPRRRFWRISGHGKSTITITMMMMMMMMMMPIPTFTQTLL